MPHRQFIGSHFVLAALVLVVLCVVPVRATKHDGRPNVLFILTDDQQAHAVGASGNPHIETPHIDRLARRGTVFTNAYCMGSQHGAVCMPSRAMINTGRSLFRAHGDMKDQRTWGQAMAAAGYDTFATGKWHNGRQSFTKSFARGEAVFFGGMCDHFNVPLHRWSGKGKAEPYRKAGVHSSRLFADAAVSYIDKHDGDKPFFVYVAFTAPHDPRDPPKEALPMYTGKRPPLPPNFMPQHPFDNGWLVLRDENLAPWPRTEDVVRDQLAEYYALITHMDAQIGRIIAATERNTKRKTLIVFTSDHGLALGSHGLLGKQSVYEHSMKSPLIFAGPGVPRGERREALVYLMDIFPTVGASAWAGLDLPEGVEGKSLEPVINGRREAVRDSLYLAMGKQMRSVRDGRWKLIRYTNINHTQLFDLLNDPHELHDLADGEAHRRRVTRMLTQLAQWQAELGDTQPLTTDKPQPMARDLTGHARKPDRHQPKWVREKYFNQ